MKLFTLRTLVLPVALSLALAATATPSFAQATLIHQYLFQGNANDSVGSAHGTLNNGADASGGALTLNGIDQTVLFGQQIVPTSGSFSVALFELHSDPQTGQVIELISQGFSGGPGFYIGRDTGSGVRVSDVWGSTGAIFPSNTTSFHHFALTVDTTLDMSSFYIDGTLVASIVGGIDTTSGGDNTLLGGQFEGIGEFFAGQLKDVRIYTGALSAGEVSTLAASGAASAPEPGTLALLSLGVVGGIVKRRRQNKA